MGIDPYDGWSGRRAHPNSPLGGGGPGAFRNPRSLGTDLDPLSDIPHPSSRTALAQAAVPAKVDADLPASLEQFTSNDDTGGYSVDELNQALLTVFGEISPTLVPDLEKEARAVASTIFNRLTVIEESRAAYDKAMAELDEALRERREANQVYVELSSHSSKHKQELVKQEYDAALTEAKKKFEEATAAFKSAEKNAKDTKSEGTSKELDKAQSALREAETVYKDLEKHPTKHVSELANQDYDAAVAAAKMKSDAATQAWGKAETKAKDASSLKMKYEDYLDANTKHKESLTLTDIVNQPSQYTGYPTGQGYFDSYEGMKEPEQKRNFQRWKTAKIAVSQLANNPGQRDHYDQFVSSRAPNGKLLPLKKGRTRIGGNDFWWE